MLLQDFFSVKKAFKRGLIDKPNALALGLELSSDEDEDSLPNIDSLSTKRMKKLRPKLVATASASQLGSKRIATVSRPPTPATPVETISDKLAFKMLDYMETDKCGTSHEQTVRKFADAFCKSMLLIPEKNWNKYCMEHFTILEKYQGGAAAEASSTVTSGAQCAWVNTDQGVIQMIIPQDSSLFTGESAVSNIPAGIESGASSSTPSSTPQSNVPLLNVSASAENVTVQNESASAPNIQREAEPQRNMQPEGNIEPQTDVKQQPATQ